MTLQIKVYTDYVCPFCFVGKAAFEEAIKDKDVQVEWMPFELRPSPSPKLDPVNDPAKRQMWKNSIEPMARSLGVEMTFPHVSPHPYTDLAFEGFHFAKEYGKDSEYHTRVFQAFFQEEQNIGDIDVLTKLAEEAGLDGVAFKEALETRVYRDMQREALRYAYEEAGITAVPTFIIGDERIPGAAGKETFEQIIERELNKR
ncbi:DsbA family oxidoreductase [Bacillus siamensis]|uniref:DsbA family oxidoreductase n=1 Tax=Bacillus siamensis TaxID=659243 RepID=UPI0018E5AEAF|nr:DsbA family oxidoreductase [Bacillus siamensis]QQD81862.1 DsbA family oxidoreductase [Bacillus siamensis]